MNQLIQKTHKQLFTVMLVMLIVAACATSASEQRQLIADLIASKNPEQESRVCNSIKRRVPVYGLAVKDPRRRDILLTDLAHHMEEKLHVTIYHRGRQYRWQPLNNDNLLLLLRQ